jgi:CXXC motif containing zinc binding protein, eukaryotic
VKCTSCHETHPKLVGLNRMVSTCDLGTIMFTLYDCLCHLQEQHELSGSKGNTAHFVWRCGMCKRESSAKFDPSFPIRPYTIESSGSFAPLLVLDCRGLEFTDFDPRVSLLQILFFLMFVSSRSFVLAPLGIYLHYWTQAATIVPFPFSCILMCVTCFI